MTFPGSVSFDGAIPFFVVAPRAFSVECDAPALSHFVMFSVVGRARPLLEQPWLAASRPQSMGVSPLRGSVSQGTVPRAYALG